MPSYSIEDLLKSEGVTVTEDATSQLTSRLHAPSMRKTVVGERPGRSAQETKALIKTCLSEAGRGMSVAEICVCLERGVTPNIRNILKAMVEDGELILGADLARNKTSIRYWYRLP